MGERFEFVGEAIVMPKTWKLEPRGDKVWVLATKEFAYSGDYSLLTKGRPRGWHGPQLNV